MTKDSQIRIVDDPNARGSLAQQLQAHLSPRSLNAAFRAYAEAMDSAQVLETGLALLLLHARHERTTQVTFDDLGDLHGYLFRRPLGNLIKRLKKDIPVPPQLEADLTKALDLRNLLAHRYFRERLTEWLHPFGLRKVTKELKEIKTTFDLVCKEIDRLTKSLFKNAKREEELVKEMLEQKLLPTLAKAYAVYQMKRHKLNEHPRSAKRGGRHRDRGR